MDADLRIALECDETDTARQACRALRVRYGAHGPEKADVIVVIGGNGMVIRTLHRLHHLGRPIFAMNRDYPGFLTNAYREDGLRERLAAATQARLTPLRMRCLTADGQAGEALAFNEVALFRQTRRMAHIAVEVGGNRRLPRLIGDGVLLATPAGSAAYNFSAHGPILPLGAKLTALTPLAPSRPRHWRGALLPETAPVRLEVLEPERRPVSAVADFIEIRDARAIEVRIDHRVAATLLFDRGDGLQERLLRESFKI